MKVAPADERKDGPDPDGFYSLAALRARAKVAGAAGPFVASCAGPVLVIAGGGSSGGLADAATPSGSGVLLVTLEGNSKAASAASAAAARYHGRAVFVAKRAGNPFPNMISLGRSTSNDIVIALDTISKLHGYFLRDNDCWYYTDYQSTNGTVVNDRKVEKGEKRLLADGDRFKIGLDVMAELLLPMSLYERVRGGGA